MGVEYSVACTECKVTRELGKRDIPEGFREFAEDHWGHPCVLLHDNCPHTEKYYPLYENEYVDDGKSFYGYQH